MSYYLYVTQSTNKHIVKRLLSNSTSAVYDGAYYGLFSEEGRLNFPSGITSNGTNIFICDYKNKRIVKLDKDLNYLSEYITPTYMPYFIFYDANYTNDLYILGVEPSRSSVKIQRLSVDFTISKISEFAGALNYLMPTGFCKSLNSTDVLVTGLGNDVLVSSEIYNEFLPFATKTVNGLASQRYMGIVNANNNIFLNDGSKLIKASLALGDITCVGKSDTVIKETKSVTTNIIGLKESINGTLLITDVDKLRILRYDQNLNFIAELYKDTGSTIALDAKNIFDFVEINI
jgi:hypothetical protein